jgi:hypothetical protein
MDAAEFDEWYRWAREWSGSAFLAGEPMSATMALDHKSQLYSDLCRLGSTFMAWRDQATEDGSHTPPASDGEVTLSAAQGTTEPNPSASAPVGVSGDSSESN